MPGACWSLNAEALPAAGGLPDAGVPGEPHFPRPLAQSQIHVRFRVQGCRQTPTHCSRRGHCWRPMRFPIPKRFRLVPDVTVVVTGQKMTVVDTLGDK
ncbi:MAG: hypothetical protein M1826_003766 [Phylliscum demangeonii]|nr:MAG: hypothetical protein M1826_003766 [Phylliscum demangeonii]